MILITCATPHVFRVVGDPQEVCQLIGEQSEFWPDKYTCPRCQEEAKAIREDDIDPDSLAGIDIQAIEAQEMFRAQNGLGLPDEQVCDRVTVEELLRATPIRKVAGHDIQGARRFCLEWFELADGTKMYFGASTHGAIVYRITRPISHVKEVLGG